MDLEKKLMRIKELSIIEENLKSKRDFEGLIGVHDEFIKIGSHGTQVDRLPKKAYCLARLGRKEEAEDTLRQFSNTYLEDDEMMNKIMLVTLFILNKPEDFDYYQINSLENKLNDSKGSQDVINIVFDYVDFLYPKKVFKKSITQVRNDYFNEQLLSAIFSSMQRKENEYIYYNRLKNEVEYYIEGYFTNFEDEKSMQGMMIRIANRATSKSSDRIINDVHFLIPRISVGTFLKKLRNTYSEDTHTLDWLNMYEDDVNDAYEYSQYNLDGYDFEEIDEEDIIDSIEEVESLDLVVFDNSLSRDFHRLIIDWIKLEPFKTEPVELTLEKTYKALTETKNEIALAWLTEINNL